MSFRILLHGFLITEANIRDSFPVQNVRIRTHVDIGQLSVMEKEVGNNEQCKGCIRILLFQRWALIDIGSSAISLFIPASLMMWDVSMYNRDIFHLIQNPLYRTSLFTDCFGNDDLSPIMLTVELVAEYNCKERGHLIIDLRIFRFPGLCQIG